MTVPGMLGILLGACLATTVLAGCPMEPSSDYTTVARTEGDGGYAIHVSGNSDKYIANAIYTVRLQGTRSYAKPQLRFRKFTLSVDSQHAPNTPNTRVGFFQLFPDSQSTFNEDCINTVSEANDNPKSEVQVTWKAPPAGSGCVVFTAMVFEGPHRWYAEDGTLSKTFCELTEVEAEKHDESKCCACDEAKYSLIMEGIWSNTTHPKDFPFSAWLTHFSDLIGATHQTNFSFWGRDHISTDGFRQLAEWGSASGVEAELRSQSKNLRTLIKAAGLWYPNVNTNTSTNFRVDRKHPLLSVASMLGPSPDWVVGVSKLNLCQKDCSWAKSMIVDLYPWDAGTDNGISYMSPNSETNPREKMKPITTSYPEDPRSPFYDPTGKPMLPLARLYLVREKTIPKSCDEEILQQEIAELEVAENTEDTSRPECATTEYTQWSPCSVSCGKGLRMRTREYRLPQKAVMFKCNRQLVSKEMCVASLAECPGQEEADDEDRVTGTEAFCETSEWGSWAECSSTCGIGFKMRTRKFKDRMGRKKCPHIPLIEKEKCMGPPCPAGTEEVIDPECKVTDWSDWSPCSATCGKGVKLRTRLLMVDPLKQQECSSKIELIQQRPCLEKADCTFDMATAKVVCMEEADPGPCRGFFKRWSFNPQKLMCTPFDYGGCRGNRNNFLTSEECTSTCSIVRSALIGQPIARDVQLTQELAPVNLIPPPIDCMITEWSPWTPCSVTCGTGRVTSFRMIKRQAENGGRPCPKKLQRRSRCQLAPCD